MCNGHYEIDLHTRTQRSLTKVLLVYAIMVLASSSSQSRRSLDLHGSAAFIEAAVLADKAEWEHRSQVSSAEKLKSSDAKVELPQSQAEPVTPVVGVQRSNVLIDYADYLGINIVEDAGSFESVPLAALLAPPTPGTALFERETATAAGSIVSVRPFRCQNHDLVRDVPQHQQTCFGSRNRR